MQGQKFQVCYRVYHRPGLHVRLGVALGVQSSGFRVQGLEFRVLGF
jgi:hypothetical protein